MSNDAPVAFGVAETVDVSSDYKRSIPGAPGFKDFKSFVETVEAKAAARGEASQPEATGEPEPVENAHAEADKEPVEVSVADAAHGDNEGEEVAEEEAPEENDTSPIANIKSQIEALNLPPEQIAKELGLAVHSKQIRQLAREMDKAKRLQREAKKGNELVENARAYMDLAQKNPSEFLRQVAGPEALSQAMFEQAGVEQPEPKEEAPDVNKLIEEKLALQAEERRNVELQSVVDPWRSSVRSAVKSVDAPYAKQYASGDDGLQAEVEQFIVYKSQELENQLGRPLNGIDAYRLLQDWTPDKVIGILETEARRQAEALKSVGDVEPRPARAAPIPQKTIPSKAPRTLTADIADGSDSKSIDLSGLSGRKRLEAFKKKHGL